jgi:selenophosphate synthetase-related protein
VLFYGVVSAQTERVVEVFLEREAAEAMIGEVREDDPLLAEELRVEAIELGLR